jgi:hypothetical protein
MLPCTFCDKPVAHEDIELCQECHSILCPVGTPELALSTAPCLIVTGTGTLQFSCGKGKTNALSISHGHDTDAISIRITSARSGRTVGSSSSVTYAFQTDVQYTVDDPHVTHIRICVACGPSSYSQVVPNGFYLQQILTGSASVDAACAWNLRNLAVSSTGQAVMANRCTNQWILMNPLNCEVQVMPTVPSCLTADFGLDSTVSSVCWTDTGLIIAATGASGLIVEMDPSGIALRSMSFPCATGAVACCEHYIAVTTTSDIDTYKRVFIVDYEDGDCMWVWGNTGSAPGCLDGISAIRFMPDQAHVVISGSLPWISMFTVEGQLIRILGAGYTYGSDIEVVDAGRTVVAIVADEGSRMITMSTRTGKYTGTIDCHEAGQLTCLAVAGQELLAFDTTLSRLFRYK